MARPGPVPPELARRRARLAGLVSTGADPERLAEARRDLAAERMADWIKRKLAEAPPLTGEQLERLRALLRPAGNGDAA